MDKFTLLNLSLCLVGAVVAALLGKLANKVRISTAILFASFFSWVALYFDGPNGGGGIFLPTAIMLPFLFVSFVSDASSISEYFEVFATSMVTTLVIASSFWFSSHSKKASAVERSESDFHE